MVGSGPSGISDTSRGNLSNGFSLAPQGMDVDWACPGLDQYKDYFRVCLLPDRDADGDHSTLVGERSYGSKVKTRPRQLPGYSRTETGVALKKTILKLCQLCR